MQELIKESSRQGPDGSPVGGGAGPGGIAGGEPHGELMSGQASRGAVVGRGPPGKAALGKPFASGITVPSFWCRYRISAQPIRLGFLLPTSLTQAWDGPSGR